MSTENEIPPDTTENISDKPTEHMSMPTISDVVVTDSSSENEQKGTFNPREANPLKPEGVTVGTITGLEKAGVELANSVLKILTGLAVLLIICSAISEFLVLPRDIDSMQKISSKASLMIDVKTPDNVELIKQANETLVLIKESRKSSRDFWISAMQLLLLNLFLPVLTAILGYIFGSRRTNGGA